MRKPLVLHFSISNNSVALRCRSPPLPRFKGRENHVYSESKDSNNRENHKEDLGVKFGRGVIKIVGGVESLEDVVFSISSLKINIGDNNIGPRLQHSIRNKFIVESFGGLRGNSLIIKLGSAVLQIVVGGFHGVHDREANSGDVDLNRVVVLESNQQFVFFSKEDDIALDGLREKEMGRDLRGRLIKESVFILIFVFFFSFDIKSFVIIKSGLDFGL
mmetsp:Transcript_22234/g.34538  ORF Transcript_22234/g.34538 Transcript_22234/m.34538 type:complete len:217 (+) Transcript_22234:83-733(+)